MTESSKMQIQSVCVCVGGVGGGGWGGGCGGGVVIVGQLFSLKTLFSSCLLSVCTSGPSCSKPTMSLVNAFAKAKHIFFSRNTCELDIVLTRTVNILTTNELVKLMML